METAKHFGSKLRKTLAALLATMALMAVLLPGALAVDLNVDVGFYFKQSRGGTCTLASAAMMLRRRAYLDGMDSWVDVTENGIKSTAWSGGLSHSFTYNDMHVGFMRPCPRARRPRRERWSPFWQSIRRALCCTTAPDPMPCS